MTPAVNITESEYKNNFFIRKFLILFTRNYQNPSKKSIVLTEFSSFPYESFKSKIPYINPVIMLTMAMSDV